MLHQPVNIVLVDENPDRNITLILKTDGQSWVCETVVTFLGKSELGNLSQIWNPLVSLQLSDDMDIHFSEGCSPEVVQAFERILGEQQLNLQKLQELLKSKFGYDPENPGVHNPDIYPLI